MTEPIPQDPVAAGQRPEPYVDGKDTYSCLTCGRRTAGRRIIWIPFQCPHCGGFAFKRTQPLSSGDVRSRFISPYNRFLKNTQKIVSKVRGGPAECFKLGPIEFDKPSVMEANGSRRRILPWEASLRRLTYAAQMYSEVFIEKLKVPPMRVYLGEMPVMVKSALCPLSTLPPRQLGDAGESPDDPGGYFIIRGAEAVIPPKFLSELFEFCFDEVYRKLASRIKRGRMITHRDFQVKPIDALEKRDPRVWGMVGNPLFQFGWAVESSIETMDALMEAMEKAGLR